MTVLYNKRNRRNNVTLPQMSMTTSEYLMICSQAGDVSDLNHVTRSKNLTSDQKKKALMIANAMGHKKTCVLLRLSLWVDHVVMLCALVRLQRKIKAWLYHPDNGPFLNILRQRFFKSIPLTLDKCLSAIRI